MQNLTAQTLKDGLLKSFENGLRRQSQHSITRFSTKSISGSVKNAQAALTEADDAQLAVRPLFGKGPAQPPTIGDHPDFLHLKGTDEVCYCPITTMFMDIESSTRLSLLYPLEEVRSIKNAFIQTAIQIVRCFDGHVHRIMGDAVMAYFGGPFVRAEDATINGLNCAAALQLFAEKVVGPKLELMGYDHEFGVRIGLDHGPKQKVLWSAYGYPVVEEVTATSFYVDVAAKLQHAAGRNRSMIGGMLVDTLDFPTDLIAVKSIIRAGEEMKVPFLQPNHTNRNGTTIDYRQWTLLTEEYLKCTPLAATGLIATDVKVKPINVRADVYDSDRENCEGQYHAASKILPKDRWIKFTVALPYVPALPFAIRFRVENHGLEASAANSLDGDAHTTEYVIDAASLNRECVHWESTAFRGLHYLIVDIRTPASGVIYRTRFGVFVE
jgi:adenylate cyclase